MAKVQKTVITALGEQMLFSSALTYTNATLCSQDISNLTIDQLRSLTDLTGKVLSSPISAHKRQGNTKADQVDVQVTFTNQDQKADINYSSIGWFARDRQGHETLIAVTPFVGTDTIAAAPPDGAATSSKNITLSMAAGTATEINVLIDPAGSVTPSTFNAEVDKINEALALKADNAELADYAKKADVNSALDTKADKATVDAEIAKIDFAPYAKSADVANELQNYTTTVDLNKLLAGKEDAGTSYSKAELDKKLLALSTDTSGKVNADQVSSMIANKVDKSDLASDLKTVNDSIATKANSSDVDLALAKKDDVTDVDAKIKTVTDLANTKANSSDVYTKSAVDTAFSQRDSNITKAQNEVDQLKGRRTVDSADFNSLTDGGTYYISSPAKNAPVSQWGNLFVSNGNGHRVSQVYFPDDGNAPWYRVLDEQDWRGWVQLGTKSDISNGLSTKVDKSQVNLDGNLYYADHSDHNKGSDILGQTISSGFFKAIVNYNESPDGNALSDATTFAAGDGNAGAMISISANDHHAKLLGYGSVNGQPNWHEDIAWKSDISSLTQALTKLQAAFDAQQTKIAALQATVNNQANQLTYFKQHYIEGKAFDADQIKQAMAWTDDDGQKLAIIRDKENEGGKYGIYLQK